MGFAYSLAGAVLQKKEEIMKTINSSEKVVVVTTPERDIKEPFQKEKRGEEPLIVTADSFVADSIGAELVLLVKGENTPRWEDCERCNCDCDGGNCKCACDCRCK